MKNLYKKEVLVSSWYFRKQNWYDSSFDTKENVIPVTVIKGGPVITQTKSGKLWYNAIQIGYLEISANAKRLTKPN
jgi:hypothetical protein